MTREDVEFVTPDEYEYRLVSTERHECSCGETHEEGDAVWGGVFHPDNAPNDYDVMGIVEDIHSAPVEVVEDE